VNENKNEDVEDNKYENDRNDSKTKNKDKTVKNRYEEEHKWPPKRLRTNYQEIIIGNKAIKS
jgi:hypothetical protein